MKPELKSWHSPDIDINTFSPSDDENFKFLLQVQIGPVGEDSSESFSFIVCTPGAMLEEDQELLFARHYIVVSQYSLSVIRRRIERLCEGVVGKNWGDIALKLSRYGHWEFEDYQF